MGSCISKCKPNKSNIPIGVIPHLPVQDKLVISQTQTCVSALPSCTYSSASSSSAGISLVPATSTSSYASSLSKERSFSSNEFLLSCIEDNQHIVQADDLIKIGIITTLRGKGDIAESSKFDLDLAAANKKQQSPRRVVATKSSETQKRQRSSSSNLTRQKSFLREPDGSLAQTCASSRNLRSPSPSRRFVGGDLSRGTGGGFTGTPVITPPPPPQVKNPTRQQHCSAAAKAYAPVQKYLPCVNKEGKQRPPSPSNNSSTSRRCYGSEANWVGRPSPPQVMNQVPRVVPREDVESMPMEDIDNPLIALDCFIFL
ncbi:hypothetical protein Dimus_005322 [Dionaea muscipula]